MQWNWQTVGWAAVALLLFAVETLAPGAFMLWLGFAATAVFVMVLLVPGVPMLGQVTAFVLLSFVSVQIYRHWFRGRGRTSDQPMLNQRVEQLVGRVVPLEQAIVNGQGRVQIADAYWNVSGPDLPAGAAVRIVASDGMNLRVEPAG
ncbi:NfeD family protein [Montanilutibacter psychrotolerans]|uniref:NfeD family protein n=1 Tax=Montanilutibacter psychrotolerans TaxID=1327343 RepID=A0A3M8T5F3_9GAMM|nr:NfeD family protein [Lysobacter psychrotolerans]RNF85972.1 NfeD family protein [Lysobacter psychrotolerans]